MTIATRFSLGSLVGVPLFLISCGGSGTTPPPTACDQLAAYKASSTTTLSFATDIVPILSSSSCGLGSICHGEPPVSLNSAGTKTLQFKGAVTAAMVKAQLAGPSVNAPSMNLVVPKNVGASFLAHKVSGLDELTCMQSMCTPNATKSSFAPTQMTACGDPMPRPGGTLSAGDKTKILDWIAQGAAD